MQRPSPPCKSNSIGHEILGERGALLGRFLQLADAKSGEHDSAGIGLETILYKMLIRCRLADAPGCFARLITRIVAEDSSIMTSLLDRCAGLLGGYLTLLKKSPNVGG
ncbi:MAG: hypothetical protein ACKOFW_11115 [Planctomycetaceae bacterium]